MDLQASRTPPTAPTDSHSHENSTPTTNGEQPHREAASSSSPALPQHHPSHSPSPGVNGDQALRIPTARPGSSRLPRATHWSSRKKLIIGGSALALVLVVLVGLILISGSFGRATFNGQTFTVRKEKLQVTIVARGSLESEKNGDISCTVRSGTKGSTTASTIKWLEDNGAEVKKGQKVIELDDSGLKETLKTQNITVESAKNSWTQGEEEYKIQKSQNESDEEAAKNVFTLAKLDLEKYTDGDFKQALKDVEGRIETARSDLENWKDRAAWSQRMLKKGLMSKVQADADESRVDGARFALDKVEEERRVLVNFTKQRTVQDLTAKVDEAKRALDRVKLQAQSKLTQKEANRVA